MALELHARNNGDTSTTYGVVGALTTITVKNRPVRVGDLVEFTYNGKRVQGVVVIDSYSKQPTVWGWSSWSSKLFSNPFDLKLIPNVENIRAGQMISHRLYAREYVDESSSV